MFKMNVKREGNIRIQGPQKQGGKMGIGHNCSVKLKTILYHYTSKGVALYLCLYGKSPYMPCIGNRAKNQFNLILGLQISIMGKDSPRTISSYLDPIQTFY